MAQPRLPASAVLAAAVFVGGAVCSPLVASDVNSPCECPKCPIKKLIKNLGPFFRIADYAMEKISSIDNGSGHTLHSRAETTPSPPNNTGNGHPEYIAYALVPVFFIMGLFGVLICHLLKKKGYRCTTEAEQDIEEEKVEKIELNDSVNENSDTVGQIVHYIMKNEANADVLKAMVADNSLCDPESPVSPSTPGSPPVSPGPLSPGATPGKHVCGHHLHTVGGAVERDVCQRCRHKRWHFIKPTNKSKESRPRRQGEVTVLSVGRFRVTKVEHKSNQKERRSLMSVSGAEGVNGEVPVTPVKRERSGTE